MRELGKKYINSQTHSKYGVIELYEIQSQLHYTKYMLVLPVDITDNRVLSTVNPEEAAICHEGRDQPHFVKTLSNRPPAPCLKLKPVSIT